MKLYKSHLMFCNECNYKKIYSNKNIQEFCPICNHVNIGYSIHLSVIEFIKYKIKGA